MITKKTGGYTVKVSPFGVLPPHRSTAAPHFRIVSIFYAVSENGDGVKIGAEVKVKIPKGETFTVKIIYKKGIFSLNYQHFLAFELSEFVWRHS